MSVAGGVSKAVDRAELHGCEALQIFAKNSRRFAGAWRAVSAARSAERQKRLATQPAKRLEFFAKICSASQP